MVSESSALESLGKILLKEKAGGFQDTTVIGGLDRFLQRRAGELQPVLDGLGPYSVLTPDRRDSWTNDVLGRLESELARQPDGRAGRPASRAGARVSRGAAVKRPLRKIGLGDEVRRLKGVTANNLAKLKRLGLERVRDLVYLFPSRHNDFGNICKVSELEPGAQQTVVVNVWEASETRTGTRRRSTQAVLGDDTGNVRAIWFNNPYLVRTLRPDTQMVVSGRVTVFRGRFVFESPEYELLRGQEELVHTGRLVPVYPTTEGLPQRSLRRLVKQALDACASQLREFLPEDLRHRTGLIDVRSAVAQAHYPDSEPDWNAARRRLAFDELFLLQLAVVSRRRRWQEDGTGIALAPDSGALDSFLDTLPFSLTGAQVRTLDEILADLRQGRPMSRLLQGEVGSGKTVVALAALLVAVFSGYQGALMAPTEILAEQHFLTASRLLTGVGKVDRAENLISARLDRHPTPVTVGLLLGSLPKQAKEDLHQRIGLGEVDILIGTHALIQGPVETPKLGLVVVDEQQRFGVMQRVALREKGQRPHLLAMSATPIPRSLAMTLYGDLDMSLIDELPPGRLQIRTRLVEPDRRAAAYDFIRKEVQGGRQAFVVCPLIDESESVQARAATKEHLRLSTEVFPELRVGLLHGRMPLREKEQVMDRFQEGDLDVLVSTPVVEVGIDIPNATVMLIDGADRFGLAQLHQFRGRVGRGPHQSHCLLLADSPGAEARERLKIIERIQDGFQLAEEDLRLRGPGDYLGTRQSGLPTFRVARISDQEILLLARREAEKLLSADPDLVREENAALRERFNEYAAEFPADKS